MLHSRILQVLKYSRASGRGWKRWRCKMSCVMSRFLSLWWHWSLRETFFLLVKNFSKVSYQLQMKGQELAWISLQHQCLFYTLHTPGESWNTRETTCTSLVTREVPRASLGLFKNWHFTNKSQAAGIKYSPLPSSNWKESLQLHLVYVGSSSCAEVHDRESRDWRRASSRCYSAFH